MKKYLLVIVLSLLYFALGVFTIKDYGMNWDEPVHYLRGQAYLHFFLTGKKDYKDLSNDSSLRRSIYQSDDYAYTYFLSGDNDVGHPPLNDILASFSNYIFYQKLGIIGDIESYHLFVVFTSALLVASILFFTLYEFGFFVGIISFLSLLLYPLFLSESHFNIKDPVEASFYSITVILAYYGVIKNNWKMIIAASLFAGLALGAKPNIIFSFVTIISWVIIQKLDIIRQVKWLFSKKLTFSVLLFPLIAISVVYLSWPYLWQNPVNMLKILSYYKDIGGTLYQPGNYLILGIINTYAIQWIIFTTPIVALLLSCFGIIYCIKNFVKDKNKTLFLILLWLVVPILRVSIFHTGIYGGVRQIMEFVPAMAILSGIGANYIVKQVSGITYRLFKIKSYYRKNFILYILYFMLIFSFIPITLKLISIHPNENVYFNPILGGLKGAKQKNFADWGTTLGSVYKQGITWINEHAEKKANVALIKGLLSNVPRIWIRPDINFHEKYYSGPAKKGEYLMEVTDYSWNLSIPKDKKYYLDTLVPVYEIKVDGVTVLSIWKNDRSHAFEN